MLVKRLITIKKWSKEVIKKNKAKKIKNNNYIYVPGAIVKSPILEKITLE